MSRIAEAAYGDGLLPGWKEPTTSRDAARAIASSAPLMRERALAEINAAGMGGLTADEVAAKLGETVLSIRPRISELANRNPPLIVKTGQRRINASGLWAKCWRVA